jgi:hypothetical protein
MYIINIKQIQTPHFTSRAVVRAVETLVAYPLGKGQPQSGNGPLVARTRSADEPTAVAAVVALAVLLRLSPEGRVPREAAMWGVWRTVTKK